MHGQQNDKYTEMHGQQNDKYTEMHGQQNDKYTEMHGQQNVKGNLLYLIRRQQYNSTLSMTHNVLRFLQQMYTSSHFSKLNDPFRNKFYNQQFPLVYPLHQLLYSFYILVLLDHIHGLSYKYYFIISFLAVTP